MTDHATHHQPTTPSDGPDTAAVLAHPGENVVDTRVDTSDSCANLATNALDGLTVGDSFLLVADHDPIGIYYLLRAERPGQTSWEAVEEGPSRWQVRIAKAAAAA